MGSKKNHTRRRKHKFYDSQSVGPKKLKVNTEGDNSFLRLRKLKKSFEDALLLDEESNDYNIIINFEILKQFLYRFIVILCSERLSKNIVIEFGDDYHATWIMLIKSTLLEETAVIKNTNIHQNNYKKKSKSQGGRKFDINIRTVVAFLKIAKSLEEIIQNVTHCLNMFSIGDPS